MKKQKPKKVKSIKAVKDELERTINQLSDVMYANQQLQEQLDKKSNRLTLMESRMNSMYVLFSTNLEIPVQLMPVPPKEHL